MVTLLVHPHFGRVCHDGKDPHLTPLHGADNWEEFDVSQTTGPCQQPRPSLNLENRTRLYTRKKKGGGRDREPAETG